MPPTLPALLAVAPRRGGVAVSAATQRLAALSTTAARCVPRQPPHSSGASFLNLDKGSGATTTPKTTTTTTTTTTTASSDANAALSRVLFDSDMRQRMHERREAQRRTTLERMAERKVTEDFARQMPRRWRAGDVYAPHDLSASEAGKWKRARPATADALDLLGLNPVDEYRNFSMLSEYVTTMGRIRRGADTGLRPVNQRRMARAIRRAVGLGLHPSVHRHPEILAAELARMPQPTYAAGGDDRRRAFRL